MSFPGQRQCHHASNWASLAVKGLACFVQDSWCRLRFSLERRSAERPLVGTGSLLGWLTANPLMDWLASFVHYPMHRRVSSTSAGMATPEAGPPLLGAKLFAQADAALEEPGMLMLLLHPYCVRQAQLQKPT